jgi:hypothetical protein
LIPNVGQYIKLKLLKIAIAWVWKFQDFSEKTNFKNTKTNAIRPKNGKLSTIIFVIFKYFPFS